MNRKVEIGLAVGVLILLVLVIAFLLRPKSEPKPALIETPVTSQKPDVPPVADNVVPPPSSVGAQTTATIFVARFASYSSESDFSNLADVMPLATAAFQATLQGIAADQRAKTGENTAYYGLSTKVISGAALEQTPTSAKIKLMAQQQESVGSPGNTTIKYQNITVDLIKEGDTWKVNGFTWEG